MENNNRNASSSTTGKKNANTNNNTNNSSSNKNNKNRPSNRNKQQQARTGVAPSIIGENQSVGGTAGSRNVNDGNKNSSNPKTSSSENSKTNNSSNSSRRNQNKQRHRVGGTSDGGTAVTKTATTTNSNTGTSKRNSNRNKRLRGKGKKKQQKQQQPAPSILKITIRNITIPSYNTNTNEPLPSSNPSPGSSNYNINSAATDDPTNSKSSVMGITNPSDDYCTIKGLCNRFLRTLINRTNDKLGEKLVVPTPEALLLFSPTSVFSSAGLFLKLDEEQIEQIVNGEDVAVKARKACYEQEKDVVTLDVGQTTESSPVDPTSSTTTGVNLSDESGLKEITAEMLKTMTDEDHEQESVVNGSRDEVLPPSSTDPHVDEMANGDGKIPILTKVLYIVPSKKSKRRGDKPGYIQLLLTAPSVNLNRKGVTTTPVIRSTVSPTTTILKKENRPVDKQQQGGISSNVVSAVSSSSNIGSEKASESFETNFSALAINGFLATDISTAITTTAFVAGSGESAAGSSHNTSNSSNKMKHSNKNNALPQHVGTSLLASSLTTKQESNLTKMDQARETAKQKMVLKYVLNVMTTIAANAASSSKSSDLVLAGCIIEESRNQKVWKPSATPPSGSSSVGNGNNEKAANNRHRRNKNGPNKNDRLEGTIFDSDDFKEFIDKQAKEAAERLSRPRPTPGGGLFPVTSSSTAVVATSATVGGGVAGLTNTGVSAGSNSTTPRSVADGGNGENAIHQQQQCGPVAALVLHLQQKHEEEKQRKLREKDSNNKNKKNAATSSASAKKTNSSNKTTKGSGSNNNDSKSGSTKKKKDSGSNANKTKVATSTKKKNNNTGKRSGGGNSGAVSATGTIASSSSGNNNGNKKVSGDNVVVVDGRGANNVNPITNRNSSNPWGNRVDGNIGTNNNNSKAKQ